MELMKELLRLDKNVYVPRVNGFDMDFYLDHGWDGGNGYHHLCRDNDWDRETFEIKFDNSYFKVETNKMISKQFLKLFDMKEKDLPPFDEQWAETFLNGLFYTYRSSFDKMEKEIKELETKAHKASIIFRKKVCISSNPTLQKEVASSVGKLDSIIDIVHSEYQHLKKDLRMVVLADYIRENMIFKNEVSASLKFDKFTSTFCTHI